MKHKEQLSFSSANFDVRTRATRRSEFLAQTDVVVPWERLVALIAPHYPSGEGPPGDTPAADAENLFRVFGIGGWRGIPRKHNKLAPLRNVRLVPFWQRGCRSLECAIPIFHEPRPAQTSNRLFRLRSMRSRRCRGTRRVAAGTGEGARNFSWLKTIPLGTSREPHPLNVVSTPLSTAILRGVAKGSRLASTRRGCRESD